MPFYLALFESAWVTILSAIAPTIIILLCVTVATALVQATLQLEDMAFGLLVRLLTLMVLFGFGGFAGYSVLRQLLFHWLGNLGPLVHRAWS